MKYRIILYITVIALLSLVINGCKDDTTSPTNQGSGTFNQIIFNGGGYSNLTVTPWITFAAYISSLNRTSILFSCVINTDSLYLSIYSPGQTSGTFQWETANNYALIQISPAGLTYRNEINSGTTVINSYGSTGQSITGSFNGKVINIVPPNDTISISCGNFSVIRSMK